MDGSKIAQVTVCLVAILILLSLIGAVVTATQKQTIQVLQNDSEMLLPTDSSFWPDPPGTPGPNVSAYGCALADLWQCVDEMPNDGNTTYMTDVQDAVVGQFFYLENMTATFDHIDSVHAFAWARSNQTNSTRFKLNLFIPGIGTCDPGYTIVTTQAFANYSTKSFAYRPPSVQCASGQRWTLPYINNLTIEFEPLSMMPFDFYTVTTVGGIVNYSHWVSALESGPAADMKVLIPLILLLLVVVAVLIRGLLED